MDCNMKHLSEAQAKAQGAYYEITDKDDEKSFVNLISNSTEPTLYIKTLSGKCILVDIRCRNINLFEIRDAITFELINSYVSADDLFFAITNSVSDTSEIRNGNACIFLDTENLEFHRQYADHLKQKYGSNKIGELTLTGDTYYERMHKLIQVAEDIMSQKLVPDIFDLIPIKKDNTFQENRVIPIFKNGLIDAAQYDTHVEKHELCLCIVPYGTYDYSEHFDVLQRVDKNRARLCIKCVHGAKKIVPLIASDLSINDILTKASYLKNDMVRPGCVYQDKGGTEYLYLGEIEVASQAVLKHRIGYIRPCHTYIRMTKKIQDMIAKATSFDDFLKLYTTDVFKTATDYYSWSMRDNPRKFVTETATPFVNQKFSVTNDANVTEHTAKPLFGLPLIDKWRNDEIVNTNFYVFTPESLKNNSTNMK